MSCILIAYLTGNRSGALVASNIKHSERNRGILCKHVSFIRARDSNSHLLDAWPYLIKMVKRKGNSSWGRHCLRNSRRNSGLGYDNLNDL